MKEHIVEKSIEVKASPQAIWDAVVAVNDWPSWKPFVTKSRIASERQALDIGTHFKMSLMLGGPAAVPMTAAISDFRPPSRLAWTGGAPGVFYAEHSFDFEDLGNGVTRVVSRERFTGFLLPLILRIVTREDLESLHAQWVSAIKEKMEGKSEPVAAGPSH